MISSRSINGSKLAGGLLLLAGSLLIGLFLCSFISIELARLFNLEFSSRESMLLASSLQAVFAFIIPALVVGRFFSYKPFDFLDLNKAPGWLPLLGVIFGYVIAIPALNQIVYWNSSIVFPDSLAEWGATLTEMEDKANAMSENMLSVSSFGGLCANIAIIALLTGLAEEMFFRGALQNTIASKGNPYGAVWIAAIIFSTLHFQFFGFIPRLLLGAWFGYLLLWSRSLYVPVFAHFINNGVVVFCSWLAARGCDFDFEFLGVAKSGFPFAACVSALAFAVFIAFFRKFFFFRNSHDL